MNFVYILATLYPLYYTGECIRSWDKAKKIHFQRLCVIWMTLFTVLLVRDVLYYILAYFYILSIYDLLALGTVVISYNHTGSTYIRTFAILPTLRELRRRVYPVVKEFVEFLLTKIRDYIARRATISGLSDENLY